MSAEEPRNRGWSEKQARVIIRSACAEAETTLADQRRFSLNVDQWNAFVAALDRPAQPKPRLHRLLAEPSILEQKL
jgi:uncharacterized protein (DUF1778 family)